MKYEWYTKPNFADRLAVMASLNLRSLFIFLKLTIILTLSGISKVHTLILCFGLKYLVFEIIFFTLIKNAGDWCVCVCKHIIYCATLNVFVWVRINLSMLYMYRWWINNIFLEKFEVNNFYLFILFDEWQTRVSSILFLEFCI